MIPIFFFDIFFLFRSFPLRFSGIARPPAGEECCTRPPLTFFFEISLRESFSPSPVKGPCLPSGGSSLFSNSSPSRIPLKHSVIPPSSLSLSPSKSVSPCFPWVFLSFGQTRRTSPLISLLIFCQSLFFSSPPLLPGFLLILKISSPFSMVFKFGMRNKFLAFPDEVPP